MARMVESSGKHDPTFRKDDPGDQSFSGSDVPRVSWPRTLAKWQEGMPGGNQLSGTDTLVAKRSRAATSSIISRPDYGRCAVVTPLKATTVNDTDALGFAVKSV